MLVEIWSDVVCPWCYIGKRRLEKALAQFEHRDAVELRYRSFRLDPRALRDRPVDLTGHLAAKYGTDRDGVARMMERVRALGEMEGIEFRFDRAVRTSTTDAHRLLHLAREAGVQPQMKERLMRAYFTEGADVADHATLVSLASDAGVDRDAATEVLGSDRYLDSVAADEAAARELGVSGVPFFLLRGGAAIPGAQETERMLVGMRRAWERTGASSG